MMNWVSKMASEVQQFGENCIESIVGDEEPVADPAPAAESSPATKKTSKTSKARIPTDDGSPQSPDRDASDSDEWAPTELRFVEKQTQNLASLGWGIVEKGAGMALALLGEDDPNSPGGQKRQPSESSERDATLLELAGHVKRSEAPATVAAVADEHPLEKLRACRGYLGMLRRQCDKEVNDGAPPRICAAKWIVPRAIAEIDFSEALCEDCMWIEGTMVGRRIVTTRKMVTAPLDSETGEPLEGEALVQALADFKRMSAESCDAIARMVVEEIAEIFARPSRSLNSTLAELLIAHREEQEDTDDMGVRAYWFLRHRQDCIDAPWSEHVARNVVDLVNFAFCEMYHGSNDLCKLAQECAVWARKSDHPRAKEIKEQSMTVRGECLSSNVDALVMLEEALEIVLALFPEVEGNMPLEPLRMGQPIEFLRQEGAAVIETEHGEVPVQCGLRHERHHAEDNAPQVEEEAKQVEVDDEDDKEEEDEAHEAQSESKKNKRSKKNNNKK